MPKQENSSLLKEALIRLTALKPIKEPLSIEKHLLMTIIERNLESRIFASSFPIITNQINPPTCKTR
jgi:hypothetical protein